jgi:hypothetical protein
MGVMSIQNPAQERFIDAILAERVKQDAIWGGPEHDQGHTLNIWAFIIGERLVRFKALPRPTMTESDRATAFRLLIEIAAVALAGYEAQT